jgi:hypothetical protein
MEISKRWYGVNSRARSSVVGNSFYSEREGRERKKKEGRGGRETERGGGELGRSQKWSAILLLLLTLRLQTA